MLNSIRWFAIAMMLALLGNIASAQTVKGIVIPDEDAIEHLEVGDQYTIVTKRGKVEKTFSGELVKVNDRWIVLRKPKEHSFIYGMPIVDDVPYASSLFQKEVNVRAVSYLWIPRDAATVEKHISATDDSTIEALPDEAPIMRRDCHIQFVDKGTLNQGVGKFTEITNDQLTVTTQRVETIQTSTPLLGKMPVVGGLFRKTTDHMHQIRHQLAHNDILCIGVDYPAPSTREKTSSK